MAISPRETLEDIELQHLAAYASKARQSLGRKFPEPEDRYRTCYQRDRDRIIYTNAFRNLQFKTQVFVVHEGDYYRTRLTHTLEVMQHARTFARVLQANEDLVEAIALAHDLGHTPFGHAGEEALGELFREFGGFDHNLHSLRVVDHLEERYPDFPGLNLTFETREGLARHFTKFDNPELPEEFAVTPQPSLEAQIVNLADALSFAAHDLEDALRVGLLGWDDITRMNIPVIEEIVSEIAAEEKHAGSFASQKRVFRLIRHLIYKFNEDCLIQSKNNLTSLSLASPTDLREVKQQVVALSAERERDLEKINSLLYDQVYKHPLVLMMAEKGKMILEKLFHRFWENPRLLPLAPQPGNWSSAAADTKAQLIRDYLAGLTDRQAMDLYEMMFEPYTRVMSYNLGK